MKGQSEFNIPLEEQRRAWNFWNEITREGMQISEGALSQADWILGRLEKLGSSSLRILEIGCGTGWMCEKLVRYGSVTGTDLADDVLDRARLRSPDVHFVAGDFLHLEMGPEKFDVIVTIDTLSHFVDQEAFVERVASLLKPSGTFIIGTQNGPVFERWSSIKGPNQGQIRRWVNCRQLRGLLNRKFGHIEITSINPTGDQGFLRIINSVKLNRLLGYFIPPAIIRQAKERAMLGQSLMAFASRANAG